MDDLRDIYRNNYLAYASYVILDRAIPDIIDGLKPVQRRILWTLFQMDDGKFHKVANVAGQTMALHPHGDAPIIDALVNLANKGPFLDKQGNFGNPISNDPAAAARYIETRLGMISKETFFNPDLTPTVPSYDGRRNEPVFLPVKVPLLLIMGAEGIAVGMATRILPHNFTELLEAEIAYLEGESFTLLPDFPSGGIMDASEYDKGRGKVVVRAKIDIANDKTLVISEVPFSTTTESVIRSIDDAAKKGKIKIDSIHDFSADKVEIEIVLPRGQHADDVISALYAFTECQVSLHSQIIAIKDNSPWEGTVDEILTYHVEKLQSYFKAELEIEMDRLQEKIFERQLEAIFIENRLYKKIEEIKSYEEIHKAIEMAFVPFAKDLLRMPTHEDREKLLSLPIRRISRFDLEKNESIIREALGKLIEAEKNLKSVKRYTIAFLKEIVKKYKSSFQRKTRIQAIEKIDEKPLLIRKIKVGFDESTGFLGAKVSGAFSLECTNQDKILLIYKDGTYKVIPLDDKEYVGGAAGYPISIGVADKSTVYSVLYQDEKGHVRAKRFIVKQFIMNKLYNFLEEKSKLWLVTEKNAPIVELFFKQKPKQKVKMLAFDFTTVAVKGVGARGILVEKKELDKIKMTEA